MSNNPRDIKCLKTTFSDISVYTFQMKVKDVIEISYVAVRGRDDEKGSVQRILNKKRIGSIKDFVLAGNMFFNTFILNWTDKNSTPTHNEETGQITIPILSSAAQLLDGQHRLAGLQEANEKDDSIGEKEILVSLCIDLSTREAAKIFSNINSEQKPVPRSLIYDLFGLAEENTDHPINRANDIAQELNDNLESPYYKYIKYPGAPRGSGVIDLSTVVSSLKKLLQSDGVFARYNLESLSYQKQTILNYFIAIKYYYEVFGLWQSRSKNPFLKSAGFYGAVEFLGSNLLSKCSERKSFSAETFKSILSLEGSDLLLQDDLKNLDGKSARKKIRAFLESQLLEDMPNQHEYEF